MIQFDEHGEKTPTSWPWQIVIFRGGKGDFLLNVPIFDGRTAYARKNHSWNFQLVVGKWNIGSLKP